MTLQRYRRTDDGVMIPNVDGRWLLASDAEAAIAAVRAEVRRLHYTDCTFLTGGDCNCRPQTSPDGEASTPHATASHRSRTSVAPAAEDYGALARIDTVEYGLMRYEQGQRDMLAKCIAAVEFLHDHNPDQASAFWYAINELRALQTP